MENTFEDCELDSPYSTIDQKKLINIDKGRRESFRNNDANVLLTIQP